MKAFATNQSKIYWIKISNGKLSYWNGNENLTFDEMQGEFTDVHFKDDEYQGVKYTDAMFTLICDEEKYILSIRTDTGYFRSFCNYLRNADINKSMLIRPKITEKDGKKTYSVFIQQNGVWLKAFYTKENPMPIQLNKFEVNGKIIYDNSKQVEFWKSWLTGMFEIKKENQKNDDLPF